MQRILCVGTLIVDIINDAIDRVLNPGEGVSTGIDAQPGGNAYNVAVDLMKLGLREKQAGCVGALGNDFFGELFERELQCYGVIPLTRRIAGKRTSKNVILQVKGEERRYHYDEGANVDLCSDFVMEQVRAFQPDVFYIGEIASLGETNQNLKQILETAKGMGCLTVVDVVPSSGGWEYFREAAHWIDVLHCNDYEAKSLTDTGDAQAALAALVKLGIALPIVSQGDQALLCAYQGRAWSIPAFRVESVDATGAGDAFTAGLIKKLVESDGKWLEEKLGIETKLLDAIVFGEAAGASCVTALGCTPAVSEENVMRLLDGQSRELFSRITSYKL
ncbi:MAG: carbohydrate kinase family protein [Anaerolineales bacterium]